MKRKIDGIIVVEGTNDSSYLSSFIDALFIETNGYDIKQDDIDFLQNCDCKIIILTDSDEAGDQIRKRLLDKLPNAINIKVNSNKCNKNGKHGVAECEKEEILNVLKEHLIESCNRQETLTLRDLISISNGQKEIKKSISTFYQLGTTKNKEMLRRLNYKKVTKEMLEKEAKELYGD